MTKAIGRLVDALWVSPDEGGRLFPGDEVSPGAFVKTRQAQVLGRGGDVYQVAVVIDVDKPLARVRVDMVEQLIVERGHTDRQLQVEDMGEEVHQASLGSGRPPVKVHA